jgi:hypothetical protein
MVAKCAATVYSAAIITPSAISNFSIKNQRELILDTAGNLTQIGKWTLEGFQTEQKRIDLFLKLTRKNLKALLGFPLTPEFAGDFQKFSDGFDKLEQEYNTGIIDRTVWANGMLQWGNSLTRSSKLM